MTTREEFANEWCRVHEAPARVDRSLRTIYAWVKDGRVRSARPARDLWVYVPDLIRVEKQTVRGRPRRVA